MEILFKDNKHILTFFPFKNKFVFIQLETPTQIEEGAPLFENDGSLSGQESGTSSPEPNDEEGIFTLLFQQCDTEGAGEVEVEKLISYIRKVRLGQQHSDKEEVYDSQEDVRQTSLHMLCTIIYSSICYNKIYSIHRAPLLVASNAQLPMIRHALPRGQNASTDLP